MADIVSVRIPSLGKWSSKHWITWTAETLTAALPVIPFPPATWRIHGYCHARRPAATGCPKMPEDFFGWSTWFTSLVSHVSPVHHVQASPCCLKCAHEIRESWVMSFGCMSPADAMSVPTALTSVCNVRMAIGASVQVCRFSLQDPTKIRSSHVAYCVRNLGWAVGVASLFLTQERALHLLRTMYWKAAIQIMYHKPQRVCINFCVFNNPPWHLRNVHPIMPPHPLPKSQQRPRIIGSKNPCSSRYQEKHAYMQSSNNHHQISLAPHSSWSSCESIRLWKFKGRQSWPQPGRVGHAIESAPSCVYSLGGLKGSQCCTVVSGRMPV